MIEQLISEAEYHPLQEKILNMMRNRIGNYNADNFFRLVIANNFCQMAGHMRNTIIDDAGTKYIINMYSCGVMPSGAGKNFSVDIMDELCAGFKNLFLRKEIYFDIGEEFRYKLATIKSLSTGLPLEEAMNLISEEYSSYGQFPWRIGKGTEAAIRQARKAVQLAGCGSLNVLVDEIGHNLLGNADLNSMGLSFFDKGSIEASITKATKENQRYEERDIPIPVNYLWMGDPTKLFDASETEQTFMTFLSSGFARRMFFAIGNSSEFDSSVTAEQLYEMQNASTNKDINNNLVETLSKLANKNYYDKKLLLDKEGRLLYNEYLLWGAKRATEYTNEADSTYKIEIQTRAYKALRLAGAYAFIDCSDRITREHLLAAFKVAEDSGNDLWKILHQEKSYVKLAKFLVNEGKPMHKADLAERLPFFKGSKPTQDQLIERAREWGYTHNITIKTVTRSKIDFLIGESYRNTDLNELILSISDHISYRFDNKTVPFSKLKNLGNADGLVWSAHHFTYDPVNPTLGNRRSQEFVTGPFNLLVLDLDNGDTIQTVREIFKNFKYVIYTSKNHNKEKHGKVCERFRVILPMKYTISLNSEDYSKFMINFYESLPLVLDEKTKDIARGWNTNNGAVFENIEGDLIDPRPFIPDTAENEQRKADNKKYGNVDAITRWFLSHTDEGNRNNMLARYGFMLRDRQLEDDVIRKHILELNSKFDIPLSISELESTVLKSLEV